MMTELKEYIQSIANQSTHDKTADEINDISNMLFDFSVYLNCIKLGFDTPGKATTDIDLLRSLEDGLYNVEQAIKWQADFCEKQAKVWSIFADEAEQMERDSKKYYNKDVGL